MGRADQLLNDELLPQLEIGPFGGVDPTTEPYSVSALNWSDMMNLVPNQAYGGYVTALGRSNAFVGTLPGLCKGFYRFARNNQPDVYVFAVDNTTAGQAQLWYAEIGGAFTQLSTPTPLTLGRQFSFAVSLQWLFITNGIDTPIKIDLSLNVTYWGIEAPATAPTIAGTGTGPLTGEYTYCVTFANSVQESSQGAISQTITVTNENIQLVGIPVSTDPQVTERNIYRLSTSIAQWRLVATINDNTTTTYLDTLADANVTGTLLTVNRDAPPAFTSIIAHQERIWGFGTPDDPSLLYYSNLGEPYAFNNDTGTLPIGENSLNDYAVGMGTTGSYLLLLKSQTTYAVSGNSDTNFTDVKVSDIGCTSLRSIVSAYGSVAWLSRQGVYLFNGGSLPLNISDGNYQVSNIKAYLRLLNTDDYANATGFIWDNMFFLSFPTQNVTYFLDSRSQQWFVLGWACDQVYFNLESQYSVLAPALTYPGQVDQWFTSPTDYGNPIEAYGTSRISDSGKPFSEKIYRKCVVVAPPQNAEVTVLYTANPGTLQFQDATSFDLSKGGNMFVESIPMSIRGTEIQIQVRVVSSNQVHIQKIAIYGMDARLFTEPGQGA